MHLVVQVHNLPPNRMNLENAEKIGKYIGDFVRADDTSFSQTMKFMHIRVLINTERKVNTGCYIQREDKSKLWIQFKYERLSDFCYLCEKIDHTTLVCSQQKGRQESNHNTEWKYGSWMRLEAGNTTNRGHAPLKSTGKPPNGKENCTPTQSTSRHDMQGTSFSHSYKAHVPKYPIATHIHKNAPKNSLPITQDPQPHHFVSKAHNCLDCNFTWSNPK